MSNFNFDATVTWLMAAGAIFTVHQRRKVANGQQNWYYIAYNVNQITETREKISYHISKCYSVITTIQDITVYHNNNDLSDG